MYLFRRRKCVDLQNQHFLLFHLCFSECIPDKACRKSLAGRVPPSRMPGAGRSPVPFCAVKDHVPCETMAARGPAFLFRPFLYFLSLALFVVTVSVHSQPSDCAFLLCTFSEWLLDFFLPKPPGEDTEERIRLQISGEGCSQS